MEMQARKRDNFMKLCAEIQFRFQWHRKNLLQELGLGPEFISISPLILTQTEYTQM